VSRRKAAEVTATLERIAPKVQMLHTVLSPIQGRLHGL
jgi:hypothetical protein